MAVSDIRIVRDGDVRLRSGRKYGLHAQRGGAEFIRVTDEAGPFMNAMALGLPRETAKALGSLGYTLRAMLRKEINRGTIPGTSWPRRDAKVRRKLAASSDKRRRRFDPFESSRGLPRGRRSGGYFGELVKAIGYRRNKEKLAVTVGWLSYAAAKRAMQLQAGARLPASDKMRRMFWASGLKAPRSIVIPARPAMAPFLESRRAFIGEFVAKKVASYVTGTRYGAVRSVQRYGGEIGEQRRLTA